MYTFLLLTALQAFIFCIYAQKTVNPTNPYGISFKYTFSEELGTNQHIKVRVERTDKGTTSVDSPWSYMFTYNTALTVESVTADWSYAEYSNLTLAFVPPQDQILSTLEFTVRNVSELSEGIVIDTMAVPRQLFIVNTRNLSGQLLGFSLTEGADYTITQGKSIEGPNQESSPSTNIIDGNSNSNTTISDESKDNSDQLSTPNNDNNGNDYELVNEALEAYAKSLYIPGNPNYDATYNPIGTKLVGPLYSLWIFTAISVIGLIAYGYGTFIRLSYRKQYYSSVNYT